MSHKIIVLWFTPIEKNNLHNIMEMHLKNIYMHTIQVQKQICKYYTTSNVKCKIFDMWM
jgi:hypothetical protein